jgi:hypothetical protein
MARESIVNRLDVRHEESQPKVKDKDLTPISPISLATMGIRTF